MGTSLRVLLVEDSEDDALLVLHELERGGYEVTSLRLETAEAMSAALDEQSWDIILADYALPQFSGPAALALLQGNGLDLPFIVVSGTIGEEIAVACMRAGAHDYFAKANLTRLVPAIERELRDAEVRRERKRAEAALSQLAGQWQDTFDAIEDLVAIIDKDYRIVRANEALRQAFPGERVLGANCYKLLHGAEAPAPNCPASQAFSTGQPTHAELREEHLGDRWFDVFAYPIKDEEGAVQQVVHVARDITERKRSQEALREREEHLRAIFEAAKDVSFIITDLAGTDARITEFSPGAEHVFGYKREEVIGKPLAILHLPEDVAKLPKAARALRAGKSGLTGETVLVRKSGETFPALLTLYPLVDENADLNAGLVVTIDITERKRAEQERQLNFRRLQKIVEGAVQTMARIVEIRDPYTAGHQQRVATLARAIAVERDMPEDQVAGLYMAGSIHDVGKISVPAEILSKPGRLSDLEFDMIKAHSFIGYDILSGIEFPWPIADIVLQHHERMDGSGYPKGLAGEDIRLEARILGVADVVEAMASHRPYRPARGQDAALEEISQNKGVLYDPQVADACLRLFAEKGFKLE